MANVRVNSLGCKVNYADTGVVAAALREVAGDPVEVVGTCCVTAEGEKQSRKEVRRALRRAGPDGKVFVTGCAARLSPESFAALGGNVVVLDGSPTEAAAGIAGYFGDEAREPARPGGGAGGRGAAASHDEPADEGGGPGRERFPGASPRSRYFLKVQDGCANACAYCVVPLVRGRPRSRPLRDILKEARGRLAGGCGELVVTGIDVGSWRDGALRLPGLLARLAVLPDLQRLRLSSAEMRHLDADLIDVLAGNDVIGRHLHVPLQSGDDHVLAAMGRGYSGLEFRRWIDRVREALPGINLTTDAIVGFPGEDEEAFAATLAMVAAAGFTKVHVFSYSARPGTRAAGLGDPVTPAEKKDRSRELRQLSGRLGSRHRQRKVGQLSEVLIESRVESGMHAGYSSDYTRFVVNGGRAGEMVLVRGEQVRGDAVTGRLLKKL